MHPIITTIQQAKKLVSNRLTRWKETISILVLKICGHPCFLIHYALELLSPEFVNFMTFNSELLSQRMTNSSIIHPGHINFSYQCTTESSYVRDAFTLSCPYNFDSWLSPTCFWCCLVFKLWQSALGLLPALLTMLKRTCNTKDVTQDFSMQNRHPGFLSSCLWAPITTSRFLETLV